MKSNIRCTSPVRSCVVLALALGVTACSPSEPTTAGASAESVDPGPAIASLEQAVADAKLRLQKLRAFNEIENLAGVYGHYVDKSMQDDIADLFTPDGIVEILGRGVYYGQDRVREYMHNLGPVGPRPGSLFNHMHIQPVIHVAEDGQSARVRSRLVVMFSILDTNAQWGAGVYENEVVLEDGVWKFDYLHAYQTFYTNYEDGWAKRASSIFAPYDRLPPDGPQSVAYDPYPAAFVPPFHYRNPVSGRDDYFGQPRPPERP
jgi:hypothetical protein